MPQLNIKLEPELKTQVDNLSYQLGLNISDVIRVMLKKFVVVGGFPFSVSVERDPYNPEYNPQTLKAMRDAKAGIGLHKVKDLAALRKIMLK
jgi:addiction module RelB/DinJ family antitoxin